MAEQEGRRPFPRFNTADDALLLALASAGVPFSIVENEHFKNFVRLVPPNYVLPCRATLAGPRLKAMDAAVCEYYESLFSECPSISATTDGTKRNGQCYWSLTLSGISKRTWKLVSAAVACEPIHPSDHIDGKVSIEAIATVLVPILSRVLGSTKTKLNYIVTDNGGAAPAIGRQLSVLLEKPVSKVICAAHRLQTVLRNTFKEFLDEEPAVSVTISGIKALVRWVKTSPLAAQTLLSTQVTENEPIRSLVQETEVRWNFLCDTIDSVKRCPKAVAAVINLPSAPGNVRILRDYLTGEHDIASSLVQVLTEFKTVTRTLSADNSPTLHLVVEEILVLGATMDAFASDHYCHEKVRRIIPPLKRHLLNQFRFSKDHSPLELMSLALNPTKLGYLDFRNDPEVEPWCTLGWHIQAGLELLRDFPTDQLGSDTLSEQEQAVEPVQQPPASSRRPEPPLGTKRNASVAVGIPAECERYQAMAFEQPKGIPFDLLAWWQEKAVLFPLLSSIALRILSIPASQAHSERLFSKLASIAVTSRAAMDPGTVSKLVNLRAFGLTHGTPKQKTDTKVTSEELVAIRERIKQESRRRKFARRVGVSLYPNTSASEDIHSMFVDEHLLAKDNELQTMDDNADDADDSDSESDICSLSSDDESDLQPPPAKTSRLLNDTTPTRRTSRRSAASPRMVLDAPNAQRNAFYAYFENVPTKFVPNWKKVFGKQQILEYFTAPRMVESTETPAYTFEFSEAGLRRFSKRATALFELGNIFLLDDDE